MSTIAVTSASPPPDHIVIRIAKNYSLPLAVAKDRWAFAKRQAKKKGSGMIGALEVVDQLRNEPIRDPSSEALHISRRPLRPVPRSSSLPISRDRSHKTASINVFKIPKKRRLKTDFKHVKERLERKHHHLTSSEKMHRRRVRMIWERRNASALKRRERFLQSRNGHR